jgi:hypothetical protein
MASAGDVNGNGFHDVIVSGSPVQVAGGSFSSSSYVVFGQKSGFPVDLNLSTLDSARGFQIIGPAEAEFRGF